MAAAREALGEKAAREAALGAEAEAAMQEERRGKAIQAVRIAAWSIERLSRLQP